MTDQQARPEVPSVHAGAPFGVMLRGALVPSLIGGIIAGIGVVLWRGNGAIAGAALGLIIAIGFFAMGMVLLSKVIRSADPLAFIAASMAVYLAQIVVLLVFLIAVKGRTWMDAKAAGIVILVVLIVWQVFAFRALRKGRLSVYDEVTS